MDSVYRFDFTFASSTDSLLLNFLGSGLQGIDDESWGLDNVMVSVQSDASPVSEPPALALFGLGIAALIARKWRDVRGVMDNTSSRRSTC